VRESERHAGPEQTHEERERERERVHAEAPRICIVYTFAPPGETFETHPQARSRREVAVETIDNRVEKSSEREKDTLNELQDLIPH
jgi:hypothetical protein